MQYEFRLSNRILPIGWKRIPCRGVINTLSDVECCTYHLPYLTQNTSNALGRIQRGDKVEGMDI